MAPGLGFSTQPHFFTEGNRIFVLETALAVLLARGAGCELSVLAGDLGGRLRVFEVGHNRRSLLLLIVSMAGRGANGRADCENSCYVVEDRQR